MRVAAAAMSLLVTTPAAAAPLGIAQGTPIKALKVHGRLGEKLYLVEPPQRNPNFDQYFAKATPLHGVCALIANTTSFSTFQAAYERQEDVQKLLSIYGRPRKLGPTEDQDWLNMRPGQGPVQWRGSLASNISAISLKTIGEKGAYVVQLSYFYKNYERCSNWEPHQNRHGL